MVAMQNDTKHDRSGVIDLYQTFLQDPDLSTPVAVFKALTDFCRNNTGKLYKQGLQVDWI
ncbi:hypothetical protein LRAMOSA07267 [Lichtheimia ramosa]|uniref:Uncharacterized protein n=1 Tax=Lichtheimia ramosa TaxID=688394 RepID=A0A077WDM8_9FUNG|nr:hypothetical protein LRAMOSA07267 [Lichtheimia ramosa]